MPCRVRQVLQQWLWAPVGKRWYGDIPQLYREFKVFYFIFYSIADLIRAGNSFYFSVLWINNVSPSLCQQILCGGRYSSDHQCKPWGPGCVHMCGKNSGGPRHGLSAAHGARWANIWAIFLLWAKGSETPGATLMYDTFTNGSICQETKAEHEHADCGFISAAICLTITLLRYFWHFKV